MELSDLDTKIVEIYSQKITDSIKYGENCTFFWFPGAGMTTVIRDLFNNKKLLKAKLGILSTQLKIEHFFGHLADKKSLNSLLNGVGYTNSQDLLKACTSLLNEGYEIVYLLGRIDDFPQKERRAILKLFVKLTSLNPRRVHILYNTVDKPWFIQTLKKHTELLVLANRMEIMPVLQEDLLMNYITSKASEYGYELSEEETQDITQTYGGVLQLTKEYIRSKGNIQTLELKFRIIWQCLPKSYREMLKQHISGKTLDIHDDNYIDLKAFGLLDLKLFKEHKAILDINPDDILSKIFTPEELKLWNYCKTHINEFIDKNTVIKILRPESNYETTLWAIDKAVSRFRKKLAKGGIDPTLFKTLKKRGYIWAI